MGLSNAFQLCSLIYASLKVIYLTIALYQVAFCSSVECPNESEYRFIHLYLMVFKKNTTFFLTKNRLYTSRLCDPIGDDIPRFDDSRNIEGKVF